MQCPECGESAAESAHYCESCGTPLAPTSAASNRPAPAQRCRCGAGPEAVDSQGYCTECGVRRSTHARDHVETTLAPHFGAVTDRGVRHPRNEDDVALAVEQGAAGPVYVIVVCDGVSSSQNADDASAAAANSTRDALVQALRKPDMEPAAAMTAAIRAAQDAVCAVHYTPGGVKDPPETTIVAALVQGRTATLGWLGDSRAYWVGPDAAGLITHDHSWVNEVVDAGKLTEAEALQSPEAHAITRCLGRLDGDTSGEAPEPSVISFALPDPCRLIVCTDGLWNYVSQPEDIAEHVRQVPVEAGALDLSRSLVDYAVARGGRDNITVAVLAL